MVAFRHLQERCGKGDLRMKDAAGRSLLKQTDGEYDWIRKQRSRWGTSKGCAFQNRRSGRKTTGAGGPGPGVERRGCTGIRHL